MNRFIPFIISLLIFSNTYGQEWYEINNLIASDGGAIDWYGYDTDIHDDKLIIGAPYHDVESNEDQGAAYVYTFDGEIWGNEHILTGSDGEANDQFGRSVAIDGEYIVVGAMFKDYNGIEETGIAYIFKYDGTSWVEQQKLVAEQGASYDWFGGAADMNGDVLAIGANTVNIQSSANAGAVYIFNFDGTSWNQTQKIHASDPEAGNWFGKSLDLNGNNLIIGSSGDDIGSNENQGSAYVFKYNGSWSEVQKLTALDGGEGDGFGYSVCIAGNTILVGSPESEINGTDYQGAVYYYNYVSGNYTQIQKLSDPNSSPWPSFGIDLSIHGDIAIIGANGQHIGENMFQGAAYIFIKNGTTWVEDQYLVASDGEEKDYFGNSVALTNEYAVVGAYRANISSNSMQGSAYVFKYGTSSIHELSIPKDINVFPNPTSGLIFIESKQDLNFELYNAMGKCLKNFEKVPEIIDISNEPDGVYLLKFGKENWTLTKKVFLHN